MAAPIARGSMKRRTLARLDVGSARQPRSWLDAGRAAITAHSLNDVRLVGAYANADLTDAVLAAPFSASMSTVAQLQLTVADPEQVVVGAQALTDFDQDMLLDDNLDMQTGDVWWRLQGIEPDQDQSTILMEDRLGARLRRHTRPIQSPRATSTRARFVRRMYRETGGELYVPELYDKQRVAAAAGDGSSSLDGWPSNVKVTVKGQSASMRQRRVLWDVGVECAAQGASVRVTAAAMMAVIQESEAGENQGRTGNDDVGPLQQGRNWISEANTKNVRKATRAFLLGPEARVGGNDPTVKGWKQRHGSVRSASGDLATMVGQVQLCRRDLYDEYGRWESEAVRMAKAFQASGGGSGAGADTGEIDGVSGSKARQYLFERGQDGNVEDTVMCANRLAEEVQWRHFIVANKGTFASDSELIAAPVALVIDPEDPAVIAPPRPKWDVRKAVQECSATVVVDRLPMPGQVASVVGTGPGAGLWLIDTIESDLAAPVTTADGGGALVVTVGLVRTQRSKKEPAAESAASGTGTDQLDRQSGPVKRSGNRVTGGSARERLVFAAKEAAKLDKSGVRKSFYSQDGKWSVSHGITGEPEGYRSDCSQWLIAMYWSAGLKDPSGNNFDGGWTGSLYQHAKQVSEPLPGDLVMYVPPPGKHVEMYIGGGKTIGHGSRPVDYATPKGIPGFNGYWRPNVLAGLDG